MPLYFMIPNVTDGNLGWGRNRLLASDDRASSRPLLVCFSQHCRFPFLSAFHSMQYAIQYTTLHSISHVVYRYSVCICYLHSSSLLSVFVPPSRPYPMCTCTRTNTHCMCMMYLCVSVCGAPSSASQPFDTRFCGAPSLASQT